MSRQHGGASWQRSVEELLAGRWYESAVSALDDIIVEFPHDHLAWHLRARALAGLEHYAEAEEAVAHALEFDPKRADAWYDRSIYLHRLGREDEGLQALKQAVALDPSDASALLRRALDLRVLGRYEEALTVAGEAMRRAPWDGRVAQTQASIAASLWRATADREIQLSDGRYLAYLDDGDPQGTPVFCFHGMPGSRLDYRGCGAIAKALGIRILAPDRPGFGRSDFQPERRVLDWPDDMTALADALGFGRFAVFGCSAGTVYAAACSYKLGGRVSAVGLAAIVAPPDAPHAAVLISGPNRRAETLARWTDWSLWRFLNALGARIIREVPDEWLERIADRLSESDRQLLDCQNPSADTLEAIREPVRAGGDGYAWEMRVLARPWGFEPHEIGVKVHLWHGEQDRLSPVAAARYWARELPHCQATFFPDEGHLLLGRHCHEMLAAMVS